jgi:hypothetical protein
MSKLSCQLMAFKDSKISLVNKEGYEIGVLDFSSSFLAFEGNAEQSAIAFMQLVGNEFQERLRREYSKGYRAGKASK